MKGELGKLKDMSFRQRLDYIWTYYRFLLAILALAAVLAAEIGSVVKASGKETVLSMVIINGNRQDKERMEGLEEFLLAAIGTDPEKTQVTVDASVMSGDASAQNIKEILSVSYLGGNDLAVCGQEAYEKYSEKGAFASWEALLGDDLAKYQAFRKGEAMDLAQSPVWTELGVTSYDGPVYLCLLRGEAGAGHEEAVKKVLGALYP